MGAWLYVKPRMETAMRELSDAGTGPGSAQWRLRYVGRAAAASSATASFAVHRAEAGLVIDAALAPDEVN